MNLLALRTQLVKETGRYDLVVDAVSYVDNGANYYINQAQRILDRMAVTPYSKGEYRHKILANENVFLLDGFRSVNEVYLLKSNSRIELRKRPLSFLRSKFRYLDSQSSALSMPLYYAEVPGRTTDDAQKYGSNLVVEGTFDTDLDEWIKVGSGLSVSGGRCHHEAGSTGIISQGILTAGRTYQLQARVYKRSTDGWVTFALGTETLQYAQTGTVLYEITANDTPFEITFYPDFDGWIDDVVVREVHNEYGVDFDSAVDLNFPAASSYSSKLHIILYPEPVLSDGWNLSASGLVYSPSLTSDTSTSYWTDEHPFLLIEAVRYLLERSRRNYSGANAKLSDIKEDLRNLELDMIDGEIAQFTFEESYEV